jgi:response regulator NasT
MDNALIVSNTDKQTAAFTAMLKTASVRNVTIVPSCGEARRLILERDFDLVLINSPLLDESGESLSRHIVSKGATQVILAVKSEHFEAVATGCESEGVLTISKPVNKSVFWSALMLAKSAWNRIRKIETENARLKQTIEDIRIIDRAKWTLVSRLKLNEEEAHRLIEKQAMNTRSTKRLIAEGILKTYGN